MTGIVAVAALLTTLPLIFILVHLVREGAAALSVDFFTQMPKPVGEAGAGMANAIVGTLILIAIACAIGLPIGIGAGLYLADYRGTRLATVVRFLADVLNGLPSIVIGIFAWQFLVRPLGHFSALAGGVALAAMMIPMVTRTTEEMVRPRSDRAPRGGARARLFARAHRRSPSCCAPRPPASSPACSSRSRASPARPRRCSSRRSATSSGRCALDQPIAALPLQIFVYAISPYDEWHRLAWAGALVLIAVVFVISVAARFATRARVASRRAATDRAECRSRPCRACEA